MSTTRRRFLKTAAAAGLGSSLPPVLPSARAGAAASPAGDERQQRGEHERELIFAGDFFLTAPVAPASDPAARQALELLHGADLAIANLESGLSTVGSPALGGFRHGPAMRGDPKLVEELAAFGIGAVSLANNHTGNYGREALLETIAVLDKAGIAHAGAGRNIDEAFAPVYIPVRGRTVALCSVYSYYYNFQADDSAGPRAAGVAACRAYDVVLEVPTGFDTSRRDEAPYLVYPESGSGTVVMAPLKEDLDRMMASVREARTRADLVVVSAHLHWGRHTKSDVPVQKRTFAHRAIDAGADLFIGHGPHVLRGVEMYRGRAIAHSIGNFVLGRSESAAAAAAAGRRLSPTRESFVLRVVMSGDRRLELEAVPIVIPGDGRARIAEGDAATLITQKIAVLSLALGTELNTESGHARLSL